MVQDWKHEHVKGTDFKKESEFQKYIVDNCRLDGSLNLNGFPVSVTNCPKIRQ